MSFNHVKPDKLSFVALCLKIQIRVRELALGKPQMVVAALYPLTNCQPARPASKAPKTRSVASMFRLWRSRVRERRAAGSFDYRDLRDLGVSRWDVERELSQPFWRGAPGRPCQHRYNLENATMSAHAAVIDRPAFDLAHIEADLHYLGQMTDLPGRSTVDSPRAGGGAQRVNASRR